MREDRNEQRSSQLISEAPILAAETLRNSTQTSAAAAPAKPEERLPLFLRVFGGTLLSIAALGCITLCQYFNNSLHEIRNDFGHLNEDLRKELSHLAEAQADLVKKEEFNARMKAVWDNTKDIKADMTTLALLKDRCTMLEERLKAGEAERKTHAKEFQEKELKANDDERKEVLKQLLRLRERLAIIEDRQVATPGVNPAVHRVEDPRK